MSTINKLIDRMVRVPKDFDEADLDRVLCHFDYCRITSRGSGVKYISSDSTIQFHSPHRQNGKNVVKPCVLLDVIGELKRNGKLCAY